MPFKYLTQSSVNSSKSTSLKVFICWTTSGAY